MTKFYLSNITSTITPNISFWSQTSGVDFKSLSLTKGGDASLIDKEVTVPYNGGGNTPPTVLNRVFVSDRLQAQIISGQVSGQLEAGGYNVVGGAFYHRLVINVIDATGGVFATVGSSTGSFYYSDNVQQNRTLVKTAELSHVSIPSGYRLSVELGVFTSGTFNIFVPSFRHTYGAPTGTDLPIDQGATGSFVPWIEFNKTINI